MSKVEEARDLREQTKQFVISQFLDAAGENGDEGGLLAAKAGGPVVGMWQEEPEVQRWHSKYLCQVKAWFRQEDRTSKTTQNMFVKKSDSCM